MNDKKLVTERVIGIGGLMLAVVAPLVFNQYWIDVILTQALIMGIAAASLIFLAAYGGMISLAQTMLMGSAGFMIGNMVTTHAGGESKGLILGWDPTAIACETPLVTADTPAARELLPTADALLVPPGDPVALAAAVRRLAGDRVLADAIGAAGRETYAARASEAVLGVRWRALLERAIAGA